MQQRNNFYFLTVSLILIVISIVLCLLYDHLYVNEVASVGLYGITFANNYTPYDTILKNNTICLAGEYYEKIGKYGFCTFPGDQVNSLNIQFIHVMLMLLTALLSLRILYILFDIYVGFSSKSIVYRINHLSMSIVSVTNISIMASLINNNEWFQSLSDHTHFQYLLSLDRITSDPLEPGRSLHGIYAAIAMLGLDVLVQLLHIRMFNDRQRVVDVL